MAQRYRALLVLCTVQMQMIVHLSVSNFFCLISVSISLGPTGVLTSSSYIKIRNKRESAGVMFMLTAMTLFFCSCLQLNKFIPGALLIKQSANVSLSVAVKDYEFM